MIDHRYVYLSNMWRDILEELADYLLEVEHGCSEDLEDGERATTKAELFEDFGCWLKVRAEDLQKEEENGKEEKKH